MTGIDKLTPYTEPDTEKVREEAYKRGREDAIDAISSKEQSIADKAYQSGLSDAWEAARKIAIIPYAEEEKAFGSAGAEALPAEKCKEFSALMKLMKFSTCPHPKPSRKSGSMSRRVKRYILVTK